MYVRRILSHICDITWIPVKAFTESNNRFLVKLLGVILCRWEDDGAPPQDDWANSLSSPSGGTPQPLPPSHLQTPRGRIPPRVGTPAPSHAATTQVVDGVGCLFVLGLLGWRTAEG